MSAQKKIIITAVLLMTFAIAGAALVGLTHENTRETIALNERLTLLKKLNTILPADTYDNELLNDTKRLKPDALLGTEEESIAYIARNQGKPAAVVLAATAPNGYNGPIDLLVGIKYDGTIAGTRIVKHRETPGLGDAIEVLKSEWILGFNHRSLEDPESHRWRVKRDGGEFDQFSGATITPRAVVKTIHSALVYFDKNRVQLFKSDPVVADKSTTKSKTDATTE